MMPEVDQTRGTRLARKSNANRPLNLNAEALFLLPLIHSVAFFDNAYLRP